MPRKVFTAGEILTAANLNDVSDQSVMVFDDASARTTAIPTPVEGMVTYLKDEDEVTVFDGSAFKAVGPGKILQVVQTLKTDTFSSSSATFADVTGASVTITPSSVSSKVLILGTFHLGFSPTGTDQSAFARIVGGNSDDYVGDAAGSRVQAFAYSGINASTFNPAVDNAHASLSFLDSPATTSATTYNLQVRISNAGNVHIGRAGSDADTNPRGRFPTTLIVMEVAG